MANSRKSVNLLPAFFRTEKNKKFLSSTLDQLISVPQLNRIDAYVGSKNTPTYQAGDLYLTDTNPLRQAYQLEPSLVLKNLDQEIQRAYGLDDLLNQINNFGGNSSKLDRTFEPKFYSYDPKIDWDKFVNYRNYYWLPTGPGTISITGKQQKAVVEYDVTDASDGIQFLFSGLVTTERLILYRGYTYVFNVKSAHNFYIKYSNRAGSDDQVINKITNNGTNSGQIIFTVDWALPDNLYYTSNDNQLSTGSIIVKDPMFDSSINVENEIVGKKFYTAENNIKFINGLKIRFEGTVYPESYRDAEFIVEGVGDSIKLIKFSDLDTPDSTAGITNTRFDGSNFDEFPFDDFKNIPLVPEYITINKSSKDRNSWSRYNRWFHKDVITITANYSNILPDYPEAYKAKRPIVEFVADIQLYNFGTSALINVDLIDNTVTNTFDQVEGQIGYYLDGILLEEGLRVIFNKDKDSIIRNKIYKVTFAQKTPGNPVINLVEEIDVVGSGSSILVRNGITNGGTSWHSDGSNWIFSQQRTNRNQAPLFDLFDQSGISYSDRNSYSTNFTGNKIFNYGIGTGSNDPILGFPLLYKNVDVEGTFLFKNYYSTEDFLLIQPPSTTIFPTHKTYFKVDGKLSSVWIESVPYTISNTNGIYDVPINLSNNPMNGFISEFTLTELTDHLTSMTERDPDYKGNNLKDLPNIGKYGTRLISNLNPLSFANHFISDKTNSLIDSIKIVAEHYFQFKFNLLKTMKDVSQDATASDALDAILNLINENKITTFPYYRSDMLPYGTGSIQREYTVTDSRNKKYYLPYEFNSSVLSNTATLIYLNDRQLILGKEYQFDAYTSNVEILLSLTRGDKILVRQFTDTNGSFVPPTPTKLGLYPKYEPKIYVDDTYADEPVNVIQGHDGSLTVAFNDYRDDILLEFEKRIFNNLKATYNQDLFDHNSILPGIFRKQEYLYEELITPVYRDFIKWKISYGVEAEKNLTFNNDNPRTFNYKDVSLPNGTSAPGHWRAIFKLYFDTDRPHIAPWEMLGFGQQPDWWENVYGPAPYTSGNDLLWQDLENGRIVKGDRAGIHSIYSRPGLKDMIPVDEYGNLVSIREWGVIGQQEYLQNADSAWRFGDCSPAENAWRRSSYWPFAVQIISALAKPALYSAVMFDTSRVYKNVVGNYVYKEDNLFLNPSRMLLPYENINGNITLTSGYIVFVVEAGLIKNTNYLTQLGIDLRNSSFNLMNKTGGFVSKDKLEVVIESVNPNSINPGILLPTEDYSIHFNVSNPVKTTSISGILIQKYQGKYVIRGYDQVDPYFEILPPIHQTNDITIVVGAKPEDYQIWSTNVYYSQGQIVEYSNSFYRVVGNHNSGESFDSTQYRILSTLPTVGGTSVRYARMFENTTVQIMYGTTFDTIQEVTDFISGYGKFLERQGFIFTDFSSEVNQVLNWEYSIKEFLYWSTQNWIENSVIALSPFANKIQYQFNDSVVDNIFNSFYEYNLLRADGESFPKQSFSTSREDGIFTIETQSLQFGLFFARLRLVQKEHAIILNNTSRFNDIIYDIETGYRQRRVKLIGFKTTDWNGDFFSPGFIYDPVKIQTWLPYADYQTGDVVEYVGNYYSLKKTVAGRETFNFTDWDKLSSKPQAQLIPNFEYKINQFEDFYSLDIDNFDVSQQQLAQHLVGYSSRVYLDNIFLNSIAQYKFYQGFIREKGTKNALDKLSRASVHNLNGKITFNEEWAFRVGELGAYGSENEIELLLSETKFVDNTQLIKFVNEKPIYEYDATVYVTPGELTIKPQGYTINTFGTVSSTVESNNLVLPVAGYVRLDDVDFALKTKQDLYSFVPGKNITIGDTIWIGFDDNGDWGVYRYVRLPQIISNADNFVTGQSIVFTTDRYHTLKVGDIIAISKLGESLNGIYKIVEIPHLNQFVVESTADLGTVGSTGILFKFVSSRYNSFDDLADDVNAMDIVPGKNIWVDNGPNGKWQVYSKSKNFNLEKIKGLPVDSSMFGQNVVSKEASNILIVSAPSYDDGAGAGKIFVYSNTISPTLLTFYSINSANNQFYGNTTSPHPAWFGYSIDFDDADGIIVAGAPYASYVKGDPGNVDTRYVKSTNSLSSYVNEGMVVISIIDSALNTEKRKVMLACQARNNYIEFGYSTYISSVPNKKVLLVGAPGISSDTGSVYAYDVTYNRSFDGLTVEVSATNTSYNTLPLPAGIQPGARFGEKITGDAIGNIIAVAAPGLFGVGGQVHVYQYNTGTVNYDLLQTISWNDTSYISTVSNFASSISMDDSGGWLFISADISDDSISQKGKVLVYKNTSTAFTFSQVINNPSPAQDSVFGTSIETDATGSVLGITAKGPTNYRGMVFDAGNTTFDADSTRYSENKIGAGTAYVYNRYNDKFIFASELADSYITDGSSYGTSISVNRKAIYVGAPLYTTTGTTKAGEVYIWNAINTLTNTWSLIRQEEDLIDVEKIKQLKLIDLYSEQVVNYLELYDPAKGKIPQVADQELRYRTVFDPAVYNTGTSTSIVIDTQNYWGSEHVGELWWDLSSLKYQWYEQGEVEYRKNNWGSLFPGCTIDIYEWVGTEFTPNIWSESADTVTGLAGGISGQPKYSSDLGYTIEQIYSPVTDTFTNKYYFWVKNTVIVPNRQGRTISANEVSNLIGNPKGEGIQYVSVLSTSSLSITNVKGSLINERIALNLQLDTIVNKNNKHTEWLLLEENSPYSLPNRLLEKKLIDSLLGRDLLGNIVPDPALSDRQKYGISVRPRQSLFKNRAKALRNIILYTNSILENNLITDFYSLKYFNLSDSINNIPPSHYDVIVEDIEARDAVYTGDFIPAELTCSLTNGKITGVKIVNGGRGYGLIEVHAYNNQNNPISWTGPSIKIPDDTNGAEFASVVNSNGTIIDVVIKNSGSKYSSPPNLVVRSYSVIVRSDETASYKWAIYELNPYWSKIKTQSFNTTLYWDYIDYISTDFNQYQSLKSTVNQTFELSKLILSVGDYVKVNNNGAGRYLILKKIDPTVSQGTYNKDFDVLVSEKGTVKIKDNIWNVAESQYGWDQVSPYDETYFDQMPDVELQNILYGLKNEIFVGNLKVYWNKFFFAAMKYVLTEQKTVDWMFKTSFINVTNQAGELTERPVYKFQDTTWYEDYLKEIKPYHSQIRDYKLEYTVLEPSLSYTTDFDLPVAFNSITGKYSQLSLTDPKMQTYPYKSWYDNRTLFLQSVAVISGGEGYTEVPEIRVIASSKDKITRTATATPLIASGKITGAIVTNPGEGYTETPTLLVVGGGAVAEVAKISAIMSNNKTRVNTVGLKFDRISRNRELIQTSVTDEFTSDGINAEYILSWPAFIDIPTITVTADGIFVTPANWSLTEYKTTVNGYTKFYTKLTTRVQYDKDVVISITYNKSHKIYNSFDRIYYFYEPSGNMPGKVIDDGYSQLMTGMEYPGTDLQTLPFETAFSWDSVPFGSLLWDPSSSQTVDLDTIYDGGSITTSTPWVSGHWTPVQGLVATTSTPYISASKTWTQVTKQSTSTPYISGHWTSVVSSATGIRPEDIILDGDQFISPTRTYAPEELVPGHVSDTIGINIFTRKSSGSALVNRVQQSATANYPTYVTLNLPIPSTGNVFVTYNNKGLIPAQDYVIDFVSNKITVYPQVENGSVEIIYISGIGGVGFLDAVSGTFLGTSEVSIVGNCLYSDVKSVYVTLNGIHVDPDSGMIGQGIYYTVTPVDEGSNNRASVTVHGLGLLGQNVIFVAFFNSPYKGFSELREQVDYTMTPNNRILVLDQPPGELGPPSANSIVEVNGKRIIPPNTTYYEITSVLQTTFDISTRRTFPHNTFDKTLLEVYKNGKVISQLDYYLDQYNNKVIFPSNYFAIGDVLALTAIVDYDYIIRGNTLEITNRIPLDQTPNIVRVITFTNQNEQYIRTEVFQVNSAGLYRLSRSISNDKYVWVSIGNLTLVPGYDYRILEDTRTIQLDVDIPYVDGQQVIITSLTSDSADRTISFKVFKDTVGRTSYRRLSAEETTYLTKPLIITDTTIEVADGGKLPSLSTNSTSPGIIFIAGERIEYLSKNGNILSDLRRATLGTGAKDYYDVGTWVMDQSQFQNIPTNDNVVVVNTFTNGTRVYNLSTASFKFAPSANLHDQIEVYFGGRLLEKPTAPGVFRYAYNDSSYDISTGTVLTPGFTITTSTVNSSIAYALNLSFTPPSGVELKVVQRRGKSWYVTQTGSLLDEGSTISTFLAERSSIVIDQLYYGGDPALRLNDGTVLTFDNGQSILGY